MKCKKCRTILDYISARTNMLRHMESSHQIISVNNTSNKLSSGAGVTTSSLLLKASTFPSSIQGDTGGRGPGLGWLWFRCSFILFSYPARSAKLPLALAELGRSWNIKNWSQPNPGPRPLVSPCTSNSPLCVVRTWSISRYFPLTNTEKRYRKYPRSISSLMTDNKLSAGLRRR